ncbi:ribonuclease H-like domain-containing protein [Tanacetum coccineum]
MKSRPGYLSTVIFWGGDNRSRSYSSHSYLPGEGVNTDEFPGGNSGNDAQSSDDTFVAQNEQVTTLEENVFSEGNLDQNQSTSTQGVQGLRRNDTGEITKLPKDRKAIGSKWIFKIKYKSGGEIDKYKARLVAKGFNQKEEIDYEETFSPVVKMVNVRCLLNLVVLNYWHVFQLDVNNTFLYSDLVETVYMKVCKLKKSLYGLKQAHRQWNAKLTSALIENGFSKSKSDYSLYTKTDKGVFIALLVYVDDIIITSHSLSEIEKFKVFLKTKFMIKDLGNLEYFLGIEVIGTNQGVCLNQRKYVLDLLSEYGMLACKPVKTPLQSKLVVSNETSDDDPLLENITDYQKLMGKFIYLTNIRLDISYVVYCLSQFMHSP